MFQSRPFLVANILTLFLYGALAGVLFLLPFDLIERRGMSASAVGAVLLPFGLIIGLLSRASGGLADRYGARIFLVGGSLGVAAGTGASGFQPRELLDRRVRPGHRDGARHGGGGDAR